MSSALPSGCEKGPPKIRGVKGTEKFYKLLPVAMEKPHPTTQWASCPKEIRL